MHVWDMYDGATMYILCCCYIMKLNIFSRSLRLVVFLKARLKQRHSVNRFVVCLINQHHVFISANILLRSFYYELKD